MSWKTSCIALLSLAFAGCAATQTLIEHHSLDVQTKMSDSIFLDPLPPARQTVYVDIHNTSDKPDFDIRPSVIAAIKGHGWNVTDDPSSAQVMLQANILSVGKSNQAAALSALGGGFGSAIGGAATGLAIAGATRNYSTGGLATAGLIGGAASFVGDALVKDVYFAAITDVQLSERLAQGQTVKMEGSQDLKQGTSGSEQLSYAEDTSWKRYRTRVLSSANQANLAWPDAQPALTQGLAQVISGLF